MTFLPAPRASFVGSLLVAVLLFLLASPTMAQTDASDQLHQLFEDAWTFRLQENPLFATSVGVYKYNDELPTVSVDAARRRLDRERDFLERLHGIDRSALSPEDRLNHDLFERVRERRIAELEHRSYLIPITNRSGFHVSFPQLPDRVPLNTVADYEDYVARLNAFERYARRHVAIMQTGLDEGYTLPKVVLDGTEETIQPQIVDDPTESRLYEPFENFPERISERERARLREAGTAAIDTSVVPGFEAIWRQQLAVSDDAQPDSGLAQLLQRNAQLVSEVSDSLPRSSAPLTSHCGQFDPRCAGQASYSAARLQLSQSAPQTKRVDLRAPQGP